MQILINFSIVKNSKTPAILVAKYHILIPKTNHCFEQIANRLYLSKKIFGYRIIWTEVTWSYLGSDLLNSFTLVIPQQSNPDLLSPLFFQPYLWPFFELFFENESVIEQKISLNQGLQLWFFFFSYLENFDEETACALYQNSPNFTKTYPQYQEQLLKKLDKEIFYKVTARTGYFTPYADYYEITEWYPLKANKNYEERAMLNFGWDKFFDLRNNIDTYEKTVTYYLEPYFFFWDRIEQPLEDFWFICFFREWAILLEDWIYHPKKWNNPKHIFPLLSHLTSKADFKPGYSYIKRLYDYKNLDTNSYYLNYGDVQELAIDKNFLSIWNYWTGTYHKMNYFGHRGWTGFLNYFREKIYTPRVHVPSSYYWYDYGYGSYATRMLEFAFFPDIVSYWGRFNPSYDWLTTGFNWFFHFGDTFLDSLSALELIRYQLTELYWGGFESFVGDFSAYQPTYFSDSIATVRVPLIVLLARTSYITPGWMDTYIIDYNKVFNFKKMKLYKNFSAELFYDMEPIDRLEIVWDVIPMDQWAFILEKVLSLYFAYNSSIVLANQPGWVIPMTNISEFYSSWRYPSSEDKRMEEMSWKLVTSINRYDYQYTTNPSIYFTSHKKGLLDLPTFWLRFLNEKFFDDSGFFSTSLHRGEWPKNLETFAWLENFSIFHLEYLPWGHFSWDIKIFNRSLLDWIFVRGAYIDSNWQLLDEALDSTFFCGFLHLQQTPTFLCGTDFIHAAARVSPQTFYFKIELYPLLNFFKFLYGPSRLDYYFNKIFTTYEFISNHLPEPYYFIETDTLLKCLNNFYLIINNYFYLDFLFSYFNFNKYWPLINDSPVKFFLDTLTYQIVSWFIFIRFPKFHTHLITNGLHPYDVAAVGLIDYTFYPLPLEFFIPGLKFQKKNFCPRHVIDGSSSISLIPFLPDGTPVSINNINQIWDFISLAGMLQVNKELDKYYLTKEQLDSINKINASYYKIHKLEYDRYLNYVAKYRSYRRR